LRSSGALVQAERFEEGKSGRFDVDLLRLFAFQIADALFVRFDCH
jgi:hypothetical protein